MKLPVCIYFNPV